jgi:hypothetical protein
MANQTGGDAFSGLPAFERGLLSGSKSPKPTATCVVDVDDDEDTVNHLSDRHVIGSSPEPIANLRPGWRQPGKSKRR